MALFHSLCLFCFSVTIHTFIQSFTHNIRWGPSPYLHSCRLSGLNLPGVPSRDSNSGQLVKHSLSRFPFSTFYPYPFLTPSISLYPKLLSACRMLDILLVTYQGLIVRKEGRGEWGGLVWHLPELYCSGVYHIVIITPLWGEHKTERTLLHIENSRNS